MTGDNRATTPSAAHQLTQLDSNGISFANNTYQFIELRNFGLPSGSDTGDPEVLAALVDSPGYRGSFVGTGDKDRTIHGPYRAAAITADSFVPMSAPDAETFLRTWAEYAAPLPEDVRLDVERDVYGRLRAATSIYQLPTLPADARETEWGLGIGSSTGFHEFVAIDRARETVTLVIATDD